MTDAPHIVDLLIAERAPRLTASPLWPLARPLLHAALGYRPARALADAIAPLGGVASMDHASALLGLDLRVRGAERIPTRGRVMIVCNHPTGLADGIAVYDAVKPVRPDLVFFANSDALRVNPRLGEVFIPVEWVPEKRTRERTRLTLRLAHEAFEAERAVIIFPAGRIALRKHGRPAEEPWAPTAVSLARKHGAPILPMHVAGPPSVLFNLLNRVSVELRDITLFHELLDKRRKRFDLTIGPLIPAQAMDGDAEEITGRLRRHVERRLPADPDRPFA